MTGSWTLRKARTDAAWAIAQRRYYRAEPQEDFDANAPWLPQRLERGTYIGIVPDGAHQRLRQDRSH